MKYKFHASLRRSMAGLLIGSFCISAAEPVWAGAPQLIRTVEGITEYQLDNGLKVLLFPDASKPTITINITLLVGSMHENYGETGMAHLLEHLDFKGTPTFPDVPEALNRHGASWNGTTWTDRTNYFETMPASDENLEFGIKFEADRMVNSFIRRSDLDSEMTVVRNEMESGENNPTGILSERMFSTAFLFHGYGHSTIGARSDVENVPIDRLKAFYQTYYQPDNAILVVAGRFNRKTALSHIEKYFGSIPKPTRVLPKFYTHEPAQDGERSVTLKRVGSSAALGALYHVPSGHHPDAAAVYILAEVLGAEPSGRLYKSLVEQRLAASVTTYVYSFREPGALEILSELRMEQSIDAARSAMLTELDGMVKNPVTSEEVERAKNTILKDLEVMSANSQYFAVELSEWASKGDWRLYFAHRDRVKKVTVEEVNAAARRYLIANNRTLGTYLPTSSPERAEVPKVENVAPLIGPYQGTQDVPEDEEVIPFTADALEKRTQRFTLPSGMTLALMPRAARQQRVMALIQLELGSEKEILDGKRGLNEYVARLLTRGSQKMTRAQIQDELGRLKSRLDVTGGPTRTEIRLETSRSELPKMINLLGEILKEPTFDAKEFELFQQEMLAELELEKTDPSEIAERAISHHLFPASHLAYTPTLDEKIRQVKELKLETLKEFYRAYYGASLASVAMVGDFDANEVKAQLMDQLGNWKAIRPAQRAIPAPPKAASAARVPTAVPDKANAHIAVGLNLVISQTDKDYPALVLANFILGGEALKSRLSDRLRQKDGLSYGTWGYLGIPPVGKSAMFGAGAICASENVLKAEQAMREEFERAYKSGFTAEEVARAKTAYWQSLEVSLSRDPRMVSWMVGDIVQGQTFKDLSQFEAQIKALDVKAVNAAMRKYLDPKKMSFFLAGDMEKAAKPGAQGK